MEYIEIAEKIEKAIKDGMFYICSFYFGDEFITKVDIITPRIEDVRGAAEEWVRINYPNIWYTDISIEKVLAEVNKNTHIVVSLGMV